MRLIDANALMKAFRDYMAKHHDRERCISQENCNACKVGCLWHRIVKEAPTIDPESLRTQGHWIGEADGYADEELVYDVWYCSECNHCIDDGTDNPDLLPDFCPGCGAYMKGGNANGR